MAKIRRNMRRRYQIDSGIKPWPMNQPMWTVADCVEANHPGQLHNLCMRMASDSHLAIH